MEANPHGVENRRPAQTAELLPAERHSKEADLVALVTEYDCSKTVETGSDLGASTLAIARVHEQRGAGEHTAISAPRSSPLFAEATDGLRHAGLEHRVNVITTMSEVALPELLRDGFEADFALIHGPKRFEDTFLEFLYLDRLLVTGGIMALAGATDRSVEAVLDFVAQARAYELCSPAGAELAVLRKFGRPPAAPTPFPARWRHAGGHLGQGSDRTGESGPSEVTDLRQVATSNGTPFTGSLARELHLVQARASELEVRVAELGACLLDAEQRAAELPSTRAQLEARECELHWSEAARKGAEHWLAHLNTSASWRLTAPLRWVKTRARALIGR